MDELIKAAKAVCDRWDSPDWSDGTRAKSYIDALRKALAKDRVLESEKQEKQEPYGYIDNADVERWERLRGTEYEAAERCYIPFGRKPSTSALTDCTLPLYTHPQRKLGDEEIKVGDKLREIALKGVKKVKAYDGGENKTSCAPSTLAGPLTIWINEPTEVKEALELMTDDWIERGQYCEQTVADLRNICKTLLSKR